MVLVAHTVLCMTRRYFENNVLPLKWEKWPSLGFFECMGKSSYFSILQFFLDLVYNESLYYCNCCMLEQISYLGKFCFLRYGPKCSWPITLWEFSINCRALKLAVSHQEINEINSFLFLLYPSNSFLRNGSLSRTDFWHNESGNLIT